MLSGHGTVNGRIEPVAVDSNGPRSRTVDENLHATAPTEDDVDGTCGVVEPDPRAGTRDDPLGADGPPAAVGELVWAEPGGQRVGVQAPRRELAAGVAIDPGEAEVRLGRESL